MSETNGQKRPSLSMFEAQLQRKLRGSVNASTTQIDLSGRFDALVIVWNQMKAIIAERAVPDISALDDLDPEALTRITSRRLAAQAELAEPTGDWSSARESVQTLKQLRAGKPTRALRDARQSATDTVTERLAVVRRVLETAAGTAPFRIKELVEQVRHHLDQLRLPEPTGESLQHFENVIRGGQAIAEQASKFSKSSLEFITPQLTQRARTFHADAVRELAQELVVTAFRNELRNVSALLDELLKLSGQFVRNQDAIQSAIEAQRTRGLHDNVPIEASIIVHLPGPKEADVLAAMLERQRCGDRRTLAGLLLDKLEPRLREAAVREFPSLADTATFGTFLAWLPAETIADAFADVFDQSIGEGHTLYELIHQFGVKRTARELWERAEPLCDLQCRDINQFNVTPCSHAVVKLPPPVGHRDAHIRERLASEFREFGKCSVLESAPTEQDAVSVVRVKLGFPLAIEHGNVCMLPNYAECSVIGHIPHLVGLLPESPLGEVIPAYVTLAQRLA